MNLEGECSVCGYPGLRPGGHADWCANVTAFLRREARTSAWERHHGLEPVDLPVDLPEPEPERVPVALAG